MSFPPVTVHQVSTPVGDAFTIRVKGKGAAKKTHMVLVTFGLEEPYEVSCPVSEMESTHPVRHTIDSIKTVRDVVTRCFTPGTLSIAEIKADTPLLACHKAFEEMAKPLDTEVYSRRVVYLYARTKASTFDSKAIMKRYLQVVEPCPFTVHFFCQESVTSSGEAHQYDWEGCVFHQDQGVKGVFDAKATINALDKFFSTPRILGDNIILHMESGKRVMVPGWITQETVLTKSFSGKVHKVETMVSPTEVADITYDVKESEKPSESEVAALNAFIEAEYRGMMSKIHRLSTALTSVYEEGNLSAECFKDLQDGVLGGNPDLGAFVSRMVAVAEWDKGDGLWPVASHIVNLQSLIPGQVPVKAPSALIIPAAPLPLKRHPTRFVNSFDFK